MKPDGRFFLYDIVFPESIDDYETRLMIEVLRQLEDLTTRYVENSIINQEVRKKYYLVMDNVRKDF